jgi:hypothetical protein
MATAAEIALAEFQQISDILAVPTEGNPLPGERKWKLPPPDSKALADKPPTAVVQQSQPAVPRDLGQTESASEESKTDQPSVEGPPKQTGRK